MRKVWLTVVGVLLAATWGSFATAKGVKVEAGPEKVQAETFAYKCDPPGSLEMVHACNERDANRTAQMAISEASTANALTARAVNEYTWQGIWSMWSAIVGIASLLVSAGTLVFVVLGVRQSEKTRQQEYRAYIDVNLDGCPSPALTDGIFVPAKIKNYGRTLAEDITAECRIFYNEDPNDPYILQIWLV